MCARSVSRASPGGQKLTAPSTGSRRGGLAYESQVALVQIWVGGKHRQDLLARTIEDLIARLLE